ncbi:hypothetical protein EUGRSUZ_J02781 [Eucalyptus grandis]|uniref:DUF4220 domain-containing protein n=2 Tax=Eucalyptus grandis TaxID=71139 RepID=A0A059AHL6_EUCGR|nr:hypothetical protein EUGRSUZ_J02781 [Eucalyptus grandis]
MEGLSSHLKELWEEWELRVLVLLSLTVQIVLIVLGRHRKYRPNLWLQALVWSLYLSADAVAIYTLGKIATRLAQMRRDLGAAAATAGLDPDAQMIAFWTPFLLLHLGGPDTITAYSLEDNELWLRHFLRLVVQMVGTLLIFFQALTGSELSVLSLLIMVSGLIKYGERVYALRAASSEQFRDSTPDPPLHCPRILEEYMLKKAEGYDVTPHVVIEVYEVNAGHNSEADGNLTSCDSDPETVGLYSSHREYTPHRNGLGAFFLVRQGQILHVQYLCDLLVALGRRFPEIYALFYLLFSDEAACWLKDSNPAILDFVERLQPLYKRRRWSGSMGQYNLLSFAIKEKHLACHQILQLLHVDQKVLKFLYWGNVKVTNSLKEQVMNFLKEQVIQHRTFQGPSVWDHRGHLTLKGDKWDQFKWSIELGFDQSILAWHIATELLCPREARKTHRYLDDPTLDKIHLYVEMSKQLSRYMVYLLVMYPFLLPIGVGRIKFRDTYLEARNFIIEAEAIKKNEQSKAESGGVKAQPEKSKSKIHQACEALHECVDPQVAPIVAEGDKSKFALYHGRRLMWQLDKEIPDEEKKWHPISRVWVEILAYAAVKCKGLHHAQQLRQGGEFLTHVWLLMAHFGLTDHFQIPEAPAIAELLVKKE